MQTRLRQLAKAIVAVVVSVGAAAGAGAAAIYAAGPSGIISCVSPAAPNNEPIQRWLLFAGAPALIAVLVGLFFALAIERLWLRLVGVALVILLGAATFYQVYLLLPPDCRP